MLLPMVLRAVLGTKRKTGLIGREKLGLEEKVKDQEQKELDYINSIRFEAIKELKVFQEKIKNSIPLEPR